DLQEFYLTKHDSDHIKGMDSKFHELVYKFSDSVVIYDTLLPLHKKVQRYRKRSVENDSRAAHSVEEHRAIYEALAAHDPKAAEAAILNHTQNAKNHIKKG
ncbi:MAG: FCD domain-containing protein, partial [Clostridia bacterium]|nr:FCD domain-containing protein [Clostridia bacterium]